LELVSSEPLRPWRTVALDAEYANGDETWIQSYAIV